MINGIVIDVILRIVRPGAFQSSGLKLPVSDDLSRLIANVNLISVMAIHLSRGAQVKAEH
jgi:hypothetical protein